MWDKGAFEEGDVIPGPDNGTVRILRLLAEGGFSVVYEGVCEPSGTPCAVKTLRLKHADNVKAVQRALREGHALFALRHPNVVPIYFAGARNDDRLIYLVMRLLRGRNLRQLQHDLTARDGASGARARLPVAWVLEIMMQVCAGLDAIHVRAKAVHRDLKPENAFVEDDGRVILFDIGSAKFPNETRITTAGMTVGTPHYMSPEQLGNPAEIDARSDLFSIGTMLFELLSGVLPFAAQGGQSDDTLSLGTRIMFQPHRPLLSVAPHLPGYLVEIVDCLLKKDPADRYPSAAKVYEILAAAHAKLVSSLGDLAPPPLTEAVRAISRTAPNPAPRATPSLSTSANPFITISVPPDPPAPLETDPEVELTSGDLPVYLVVPPLPPSNDTSLDPPARSDAPHPGPPAAPRVSASSARADKTSGPAPSARANTAPSRAPDPNDWRERWKSDPRVFEATGDLPQRHREAFGQVRILQNPVGEVALKMGVPPGTVRVLVREAIAMIQTALGDRPVRPAKPHRDPPIAAPDAPHAGSDPRAGVEPVRPPRAKARPKAARAPRRAPPPAPRWSRKRVLLVAVGAVLEVLGMLVLLYRFDPPPAARRASPAPPPPAPSPEAPPSAPPAHTAVPAPSDPPASPAPPASAPPASPSSTPPASAPPRRLPPQPAPLRPPQPPPPTPPPAAPTTTAPNIAGKPVFRAED